MHFMFLFKPYLGANKSNSAVRRTLYGNIRIFAAQPRGGLLSPLEPRCSLGCCSQRNSSQLKLTAGAAAPLSDLSTSCQIVLKRRMASLDSVQQRGGAARSAGIYPADYFHMRSRR